MGSNPDLTPLRSPPCPQSRAQLCCEEVRGLAGCDANPSAPCRGFVGCAPAAAGRCPQTLSCV